MTKKSRRAPARASAVVNGLVVRRRQVAVEAVRAAPGSASRSCPLCAGAIDREDSVEMAVGPIFVRICNTCSGPVSNLLGLAGWIRSRMK